jgi:hypothetical protein
VLASITHKTIAPQTALKKPPDCEQAYGVFIVKLREGRRNGQSQGRGILASHEPSQVDAVVDRVNQIKLVARRPRLVALEVNERRAARVRVRACGAVLVRERELSVVVRRRRRIFAVRTSCVSFAVR